jgi:hypothetical protein
LTRSPILRALSLTRTHQVKSLVMGGQACVLYGAAEFSRDLDLALLVDEGNLERFRGLLAELQAERIAIPPFEPEYLLRGHAVHFRCRHPEALNLRLDVMAKMRGVDPFSRLWERRTTLAGPEGEEYELLSLPDLVKAKKTQRDKDWPMIRRLVEASYFARRDTPTETAVGFWLRELRTPEILIEVARNHRSPTETVLVARPLLSFAVARDRTGLRAALAAEEQAERDEDRRYWEPLRRELERLRQQERRRQA